MEILGLSPSTPKPTSRIRELFWPDIRDEVAAVTAARNAMYACLLIAISTGVLALISGQSAWIVVDVLLFTMAGIGVRQLSRAAAITAFVMFALGWLAAGGFNILRPILLAVLLGGVRAATFARNLKKETRESIANPAMDTTTMSRLGVVLEDLPRRAWPVIHGPFLVVMGLLVAVNLFALNSLLIGQLLAIRDGSMEPTIYAGDRVFVLHPLFSGAVKRGDVIAVRYPIARNTLLIERVVGIPGDHLKFVNKSLWLNGRQVDEPYVQHSATHSDFYRENFPAVKAQVRMAPEGVTMLKQDVRDGEVVVPPGKYLALADSRDVSIDGRYLGFAGTPDFAGRPLFYFGRPRKQPWQIRYPLGSN